MDKLIQNPEVKTFGCRLNFWESEIIKDQLVKNEIFEKLIIFNTCSVTEEAERKVKKSIRQMSYILKKFRAARTILLSTTKKIS